MNQNEYEEYKKKQNAKALERNKKTMCIRLKKEIITEFKIFCKKEIYNPIKIIEKFLSNFVKNESFRKEVIESHDSRKDKDNGDKDK